MKILLAVTGSISAYKAYDIARALIAQGHQVRAVLSQGALEFIKAETFHYLGVERSYLPSDDFNISQKTKNVLHIELADWMDMLVVAPLSANTLAKFATGMATDLLTSIFLAMADKPAVLFPAMNTRMLSAPATQRNLKLLSEYTNIWIHPTAQGELACGDIGEGKLPAVEVIAEIAPCWNPKTINKKVLITTGGTISRLDPVRYLTNPASGLTGYLLAKAYLAQGAEVDLVYGVTATSSIQNLKFHPRCRLYPVESTQDMDSVVEKLFPQSDVYVSAAAVSDIAFVGSDQKIKKSNLGDSLKIEKTQDILAKVLENRNQNQKVIGFAAESGNDQKLFLDKWNRKPVDLLVGNFVDAKLGQGFGAADNTYYFIENGQVIESSNLTKVELANKIVTKTL